MLEMLLESFLVVLLMLSLAYWLVVWVSAWEFFRGRRPAPGGYRPAVSILKPVKGLDSQAAENFASFCRQEYGEFEILFGVNDTADPAVPVVRQLQVAFPRVPIRLVVVPEGALNAKVGILDRLVREARHDVLVVADAEPVEPVVGEDSRQREAAAHSLAEDDDVGLYVVVVSGEHRPHPPEAGLHLIPDEQSPVAVTHLANTLNNLGANDPRVVAAAIAQLKRPRLGCAVDVLSAAVVPVGLPGCGQLAAIVVNVSS